MTSDDISGQTLASQSLLQWEPVLQEFENAWQSGKPPRIEDFVGPNVAARLALLVELVHTDLEYRLKAGQQAVVEDYLARFPELQSANQQVVDLIAAEYRLCLALGRALQVEDYLRRFPRYRSSLAERLREAGGNTEPPPRETVPPDHDESSVSGMVRQTDVVKGNATPEVASAEHRDRTRLQTAPPASVGDPAWPKVWGYELLGVLGKGGMGVVYKARRIGLNRLVALKMILHGDYADEEQKQRFRREAEAVARLRHPNIVQIHDVGEHLGQPFLALEYCDGGTLRARIKDGPMPPLEAAHIMESLARAVDVAHQNLIIHRDLKPDNILLQSNASGSWDPVSADKVSRSASPPARRPLATTLKISDFGLARKIEADATATQVGGLTQTGHIVGTPSYMPPEQARGERVGTAADIYALGAILYELLTGRPPFVGSVTDVFRNVLMQEPAMPRSLNRTIPRDLETICMHCLHKEPAARYGNAEALAEDLRRFQAGELIRVRPAGPLERVWKWTRRRPAVAALLATLALLLLAGSGAAAWYVNDRADRRLDAALRAADLKTRTKQVDSAVNAALDEQNKLLTEARLKLNDPVLVAEFLSDIDLWEATIAKARQAYQRAVLVSEGSEALLETATVERLQQAEATQRREERCLDLGKELDAIRSKAATFIDKKWQPGKVAADYQRFFEGQSLDFAKGNKEQLAAAVQQSPVRFPMVAALDHWAEICLEPGFEDRHLLALLLDVARTVDPDPWRDRFRRVEVWSDAAKLSKLAAELKAEHQAPSTVVALAHRWHGLGGKADAMLRIAALHHPRDVWLHLGMALVAKEPADKVACYLAVLAVRPKSLVAYNELANTLVALKNPAGAIDACNKAIQLDSSYAPTYNSLGVALQNTKNLSRAVDAYNKAIQLDPKYAAAYSNLGNTLRDQKKYAQAIDAYKKAMQLDAKYASPYIGLGTVLRAQKDLPGAIDAYKKAIQLDPHSAIAHNNLGNVLAGQKRLPEAIEAFKKAIKCDPKDALAYSNLTNALAEQGDLEGAIAAGNKAILLDPDFAAAHYNLGIALAARNKLSEAVSAYKKAILLDPNYAFAYNNLGTLLENQKDFTGALEAYKKAIQLDPNFAAAYHNLGNVQTALKNLPEAIDAHNKAIQLDPDLAMAYNGLGVALVHQKSFAAAIDAYRKAMKLDPNAGLTYCNLAIPLRLQGKLAEAAQAMRRGHDLGLKQPGWQYPSADWVLQFERIATLAANEKRAPTPLEALRKGMDGQLGNQDSMDVFHLTLKSYRHSYPVQLEANQAYQIDLTGDFDVFLRIEDANFTTLAYNDDVTPGSSLNARLVFTAEKSGLYHLVVTSVKPGDTGKYQLAMKSVNKDGPGQIVPGELKTTDAKHDNCFRQFHRVKLVAGRPYVFELASSRFDTLLALVDPTGKQVLTSNSQAGDFAETSRIDFSPTTEATYFLIVTTTQPGMTGPYTLRIQGYQPAGDEKKP